jgi:CPA2 family monovalent cation:H+ antiporter-2
MAHVPLLDELALVAALAVLVTVLLARLKLPTVAGLLAAGALAGPFGLGLVRSVHAIEVLAEVGVVLLLFTIGLEFSLSRLRNIFQQVALGGALQVGATTLVTAGVALAFGLPAGVSIFYGFVFALSSTAIVLRALSERRELDAPHGRFIVGTLIFQDLCVVPMVLVIPLLGGNTPAGGAAIEIGVALGKATVLVVATLGVARFVVPKLFGWVDASRSREVFLLAVLGICIGTAWLTSLAGLSLALGAFLGGMLVADTEYGHRAMGDVLPLRDAFVSIFFVSLGMLFDVRVVATEPLLVTGLLAGFMVAKAAVATVSALAMRFPARVAWLAGIGLAQFGEFGFVLVRLGEAHGVADVGLDRHVLGAGILSMFLTPLLVRAAPHITAGERLLAPLERLIGVRSLALSEPDASPVRDHVVLVGFGVAGRLAARALDASNLPYVALELNAETVRQARAQGLPVFYADATSQEALGHAHLTEARVLILLMNDPAAANRVIDTAQRVAPHVPILARARYLGERTGLLRLGANEVVAEEVEGAIEIIVRMLRALEVPRNVIEESVQNARQETQQSERKQTFPRPALADQQGLAELKVDSVLLRQESPACGRSPVELELRSRTGALVVAVRRRAKLLEHLDRADTFQPDDVVYLVGRSDAIRAATQLLVGKPSEAPPDA